MINDNSLNSLRVELGQVLSQADAVYEQSSDENARLLADSVVRLAHVLQVTLTELRSLGVTVMNM